MKKLIDIKRKSKDLYYYEFNTIPILNNVYRYINPIYNRTQWKPNLYDYIPYDAYDKKVLSDFKNKKKTFLKLTSENTFFTFTDYITGINLDEKRLMEDIMNNTFFNSPQTAGYLNMAKNYALNYALTRIKNEFGIMLKMHFDPKEYKKFLSWLKKYDKNFKSHIQATNMFGTQKEYRLKDCNFIVKCGYNTFAHIYTQTAIKNTLTKVDIFSDAKVNENEVYMYVFGKECYKVAKIMNKIKNLNNTACFKVSAPSRGRDDENATPEIYYEELNGRSKDSIFLDGNIKENILNHIDKFLANREMYMKRNLSYKTGILLEGPPGTGKTSIANMIATEYNCDMVLINMSEFSKINTDFLATTINADDKFYVVVLEDIDCVIGDRQDENDDLENKKNVNKLLQFLDSTSSPTNVVFVATTNHVEKLDDAIKRDGRFDLIVNIGNINKSSAIKMCESFGIKDKDKIDSILDGHMTDGKINPAKLQNLILQNIELDNKAVIGEEIKDEAI